MSVWDTEAHGAPRARAGGIMGRMPYPEPVTVRERIRQHLATATRPLTTRRLAELADTKPEQAARALRRLEDDGHATRQLAAGGCYAWTATR